MIDLVKRFFNRGTVDSTADGPEDRPHDIRVATCALFLEMAGIDGEFSESERDRILTILKKQYRLPGDHADALIAASEERLKKSIDLWQFTSLINQNYSVDEKIQIIEMVWEIAYSDGRLDKHEDYLVHKLAKLLRLDHKQLIDAKVKALKNKAS